MDIYLICGAFLTALWMHQGSAGETDPELDAQVRSALLLNLGAAAHDIRVQSHGGTVRLTGFVSSYPLWLDAQAAAADVDGVNHVLNVVEHGSESPRTVQ